MSRTVLVLIATGLSAATFPAGTVSAGIQATLTGLPPVIAVANPDAATNAAYPLLATLPEVPAGSYDLAVAAVDPTGTPLGATITATVVVADIEVAPPATVAVTIPSSLSVVIR